MRAVEKIFTSVYVMYTLVALVARQISVSNEVYALLLELKGEKSFSEVIKESIIMKKEKSDIIAFAGVLKDEKISLERLSAKIAQGRESNYGRPIE